MKISSSEISSGKWAEISAQQRLARPISNLTNQIQAVFRSHRLTWPTKSWWQCSLEKSFGPMFKQVESCLNYFVIHSTQPYFLGTESLVLYTWRKKFNHPLIQHLLYEIKRVTRCDCTSTCKINCFDCLMHCWIPENEFLDASGFFLL